MNREIKFRGKTTGFGGWVDGSLQVCKNGKYRIHFWDGGNEVVRPETIGQYTGLKDKNGKEIYEGDIIVQQGYSGKRPMLVRFEHGAFITGEHSGSSTSTRPMLIQKRCVVIGNIHDNPELLNRK